MFHFNALASASSKLARGPAHALTARRAHWLASFRCGDIAHQTSRTRKTHQSKNLSKKWVAIETLVRNL